MKNMIALTGIGYDIHRFAEVPRPLMLGGVHIPSSRGLDGHSDADVLCHSIADALLGAAGLPDIGYWFPPGDPACKDIPSLDIVAKAVSLIRERGGRIVNVDSSLIAESPRISPYLEQMKELWELLWESPRPVWASRPPRMNSLARWAAGKALPLLPWRLF